MNKENLKKIKADIKSIDWENLLNDANASESFDKVHNKIIESLDKHAPEYEFWIQNKRENKPWISKSIANSIRKSKQLFKKAIMDLTHQDKYQSYMKWLNKIKRVVKLEYYQQKCKNYKQNIKKLWKLINKINKKL